MHVKFLLFTNAVLVFANNVPWPNHRRFYPDDQRKISLSTDNDSKFVTRGNNEQLQPREFKRDRPIADKRMTEKEEEIIIPWNLSKESDRLEFQIQGHKGPQTYIFGFDTGYGKNRQYRLEERLLDGTIKGQYGYYDAKGQLRTVRYVAKPSEGYKEVHHEKLN